MVGACRHAASSSDPSMTISEATRVTTAERTGSAGLACWEAATNGASPTMQNQAQVGASARIRSEKRPGTGRPSWSLGIGCPGGRGEPRVAGDDEAPATSGPAAGASSRVYRLSPQSAAGGSANT